MTSARAGGLILAAPASGSGKTIVTAALARAWRRRGLAIAPAKVGPDFIDPGFHHLAAGRPCASLDVWAMRPPALACLVDGLSADVDLVLCEGVMGLFDGIDEAGTASTADLAALTRWPVVLVIDARGQSASAAALVDGFARHRADVAVAAVIFNRVGGPAHAQLLRQSIARARPDIAVLGAIPRDPALALPERHLGLVQAREHADLDRRLDAAASLIASHVDLDRLLTLARPSALDGHAITHPGVPPLGQRIAVAMDDAFAFVYPHVLAGWRAAGAEIKTFSPLADEAPDTDADGVFLPGGYPELHAGRLAAASQFLSGLRAAARRGAAIHGECGGYMVMGRALIDGDGRAHAMAGLLALETSFAARRLHLGYRDVRLLAPGPLGIQGAAFRGHEFHYATILAEGEGEALFHAADARGTVLTPAGRRSGSLSGSFVHLIDRR